MYRKMITKAPIIEMFVLSGNKLNILKTKKQQYELKDSEKNQYTYGLYIKQIIN